MILLQVEEGGLVLQCAAEAVVVVVVMDWDMGV